MEDTLKYLDKLREVHSSELDSPTPVQRRAMLEVTRYLESTLAILVRSLGGRVEDKDMKKIAARILGELASDYVDGIVSTATNYWNIEYERKDGRVFP